MTPRSHLQTSSGAKWVKTERGLRPKDPRMAQIVFEIEAGVPFPEIADRHHISVSRVSKIRDQAGLPRRIKSKS